MKKPIYMTEPGNHIAMFQEQTIRRVWHHNEWRYAIADMVGAFRDSESFP